MMPGQTQSTIPSHACQQEVRRGRGLEHFVRHGVLVPRLLMASFTHTARPSGRPWLRGNLRAGPVQPGLEAGGRADELERARPSVRQQHTPLANVLRRRIASLVGTGHEGNAVQNRDRRRRSRSDPIRQSSGLVTSPSASEGGLCR